MRVAIQMDPIGSIDINADSTFRLAEEAQTRGAELFYYTPDALALDEGRVTARGHALTVRREIGNHADLGPEETVNLADFDVVWLRQDPPFDMGYITSTHILERLPASTLVVNDPFGCEITLRSFLFWAFLISLHQPQLRAISRRYRHSATVMAT